MRGTRLVSLLALMATVAAGLLPVRVFAGCEVPICTNTPAQQWMPAASGTRVVWADQRSGNWDIYMYDLTAAREQAICTAAGDQMWPEIDGDRIVWMDHRGDQWSVYLHDLGTQSERELSEAPITGDYDVWTTQGPDISGDYVVWSDSRNGDLDVFLYDLSTSTSRQITVNSADQGRQGPRVQGSRIVWRDERNDAAGDIYLYDILAGQESVVAEGPDDQAQPDIWSDVVVWREAGLTSFDISYRNLSGGSPQPLITSSAIEDHPRLNSRWLVWSAHEMNPDNTVKWEATRALDLRAMAEVSLAVSSSYFGNLGPAISDSGIVAFEDFRNGTRDPQVNGDIYAYIMTRFSDVLLTYWAHDAVDACARAGIVSGYPDGLYHPDDPVSRDQMAVYVSRALAGGDGSVPTGPAQATFDDVPTDYWAYRHVEYAYANAIVIGYPDGLYHPAVELDRGQMAVFIARAIATPTGEAGVPDLGCTEPPFPDVPCDFWARKHVQYIKDEGVTGGYPDGLYRPEYICTRDQMAVYVARAFELPA